MKFNCINNGAVEVIGLCEVDKIEFETDIASPIYLKDRNWTEISIPEILQIPCEKPNIESINKILINVKIVSKTLIETPSTVDPNAEGTFLTGRKLIIEGLVQQKVVYTANVPQQNVHSAHFNIPFSAFIVLGPHTVADPIPLDAVYCVDVCIEDVYIKIISPKEIFKNVTLFLRARPIITDCP